METEMVWGRAGCTTNDRLQELANQLASKGKFAIISSNSSFEFMKKESGNRGAKDNFAKIKEFYYEGKHYKKVAKVTQQLLKELNKLKKRFPNFIEVIMHIENHLTLKTLGNKNIQIDPLYIWGEPGIGKTEFVFALSEVFGVDLEKCNAGQLGGAIALAGSEPQWSDSAPGLIVQGMMRSENANFIFFMDELEKVNHSGNNGNPLNALYDLLEERSASQFVDQAFTSAVLFDASALIFMASGNSTEGIHPALLSRLNVFEVPLPTIEHMKSIIQNIHVSILEGSDWGSFFDTKLSEEVIDVLIKDQRSVRQVKKSLKNSYVNAYQNKRSYLIVDDLEIIQDKTVPMGFY
ncbi:Lon protease [Hydrogenovibrio crunogenus]|uniref:Lon protease n=2 Tax=Hydrogenovibrio crunogenus TaxID=39765 RepID=A0A4P7NZ01_9GAMM|nr:Lon protease [Hydrogenovibrio crunogenus]